MRDPKDTVMGKIGYRSSFLQVCGEGREAGLFCSMMSSGIRSWEIVVRGSLGGSVH